MWVTNYENLEHHYTNTQNSEMGLVDWIALGVIIIVLIVFAIHLVKLIKEIWWGK